MAFHISVIVTRQSRIVESRLLSIQESFPTADASVEFRDEIDKWLELAPIPGQPMHEFPTDQASLLALELPHILGSRDPALFSPYYLDREGDLSRIEHRPYDWTRLEIA